MVNTLKHRKEFRMQELKILWLGSHFIFKVNLKDIQTFKDCVGYCNGVFDLVRELDFLGVDYKYIGSEVIR